MAFVVKSLVRSLQRPSCLMKFPVPLRATISGGLNMQQRMQITTLQNPSETQTSNSLVLKKIDDQLNAGEEGRMFAVVQLCGKQFQVTAGDIILVEGYWAPNIGDEIRLEKVLLAGARDFTLLGRPILLPGLVNVTATIIEKTLTHTKTHFRKLRRKQYMRTNFQRSPNTMIRINTINIEKKLQSSDKQPMLDANEMSQRFV